MIIELINMPAFLDQEVFPISAIHNLGQLKKATPLLNFHLQDCSIFGNF